VRANGGKIQASSQKATACGKNGWQNPASHMQQFPRHRAHLHPNSLPSASPLRTQASNLSWVGIATVRKSSFFNFWVSMTSSMSSSTIATFAKSRIKK
jgi:hypothetical protein